MEAILMSYSDAGFTCESAKLHPEKTKEISESEPLSQNARLFVWRAASERERERKSIERSSGESAERPTVAI